MRSLALTGCFAALLITAAAAADVPAVVKALMSEEQRLADVPFAEVVEAATGKRVVPLAITNSTDRELISRLSGAMEKVLRRMNEAESGVRQKRRINEVSALFESAIRQELNAVPGFSCDFPRTSSGVFQRSGYPDLRLLDRASGRVIYLDPKLYERGSRNSSLRTFYFEPKRETNKILDDAHHMLVAFEHDGQTGEWKFLGWELVDLSGFKVRLKAEFQGSNRDLYRPENVLASSRTNGAPVPAPDTKKAQKP